MPRYSIAIDISRCDGCGSCLLACKDEYVLNDHLPLSAAQPNHGQKWLRLNEIEQGENSKIKMDYIPVMCQHCTNPVCAAGAPEGAVYTRPDGIVIIDPVKAKGCREMVNKCPYSAIFWNEEQQIPQKCTMCAHMLDSGECTTRCVESCPTQALHFGDLDDPNSDISKYVADRGDFVPFKPEFGTQPALLYRELPQVFITGEVLLGDKTGECCEGAKVSCKCLSCGEVRETVTDCFGDFEFKHLKRGADYEITASFPGYQSKTVTVRLAAAMDLGLVVLDK